MMTQKIWGQITNQRQNRLVVFCHRQRMKGSYKKGTVCTQHFISIYRKQLLETYNRHTSIQEGAGDYKKNQNPTPKTPKCITGDWTQLPPPCCQGRCRKQFVPAPTGSDTPGLTGTHLLQLTSSPLTRRAFFENSDRSKDLEACWVLTLLSFPIHSIQYKYFY